MPEKPLTAPSRTATASTAPGAKPKDKDKEEHRDSPREIAETVVFVVVLVLLLKTFVAEAFVIPTGSMAETLLGYQKWVECPQCHETFPVNCSAEVDPQHGRPVPVTGCRCPNCRYHALWLETDFGGVVTNQIKAPPSWGSGDRVLVAKF